MIASLPRSSAPRTPACSSPRPTKGPEGGSQLRSEDLGLFPCREVSALVDFVEVEEVGVGAHGPAPGCLVDLARKDRNGYRDLDLRGLLVHRTEVVVVVLPVELR